MHSEVVNTPLLYPLIEDHMWYGGAVRFLLSLL